MHIDTTELYRLFQYGSVAESIHYAVTMAALEDLRATLPEEATPASSEGTLLPPCKRAAS